MTINKDIKKLSKLKNITEVDFIKIFNRYSQTDALDTLGSFSISAMSKKGDEYEPSWQFVWAYYANLFLLTKSYRQSLLSEITPLNKKNLVSLYFNNMTEILTEDNDLDSFLLRANYEQFRFSDSYSYKMARDIILYEKISEITETVISEHLKEETSLKKIFKKSTNLEIYDYYKVASYINASPFSALTVDDFNNYFKKTDQALPAEALDYFFEITSKTPQELKEIDKNLNSSVNLEKYTKTRFNPLRSYPVVKMKDRFIIPNRYLFIERTFSLFWWFEEYYYNLTANRIFFRENIFRFLFEEYIVLILKSVYGEANVYRLKYLKDNSNAEFFDCILEEDNFVYLFEAKAYQLSIQTINSGNIDNEIYRRFIAPKIQCYMRIKDYLAGVYNELKILNDKKLIPIIIYYDIPLVSGDFYNKKIESVTKKMEEKILKEINENNIENFNKFKVYTLNIGDLEVINNLKDNNLSIIQCLQPSKSFIDTIREYLGTNTIKSTLLDKTIDEYFQKMFKDLKIDK